MQTTDKNIETFTYSEFLDYAKVTKSLPHTGKESVTGSKKFTETKDIDEAFNYAIKGWDVGIKELKRKMTELSGVGDTMVQAIVGGKVNVQAAILGLPLQMYRKKGKTSFALPRLTIYVPLCYSAYNDAEDALYYCAQLVNIVNKLNVDNTVEIVGVFSAKQEHHGVKTQFIALKRFDQKLVLNNLAFAFHPSFFRRIWFAYLETKQFWTSGYGRPASFSKITEVCKAYHGGKNRAVLMPSFQDFGKSINEEKIEVLCEK